MAVDTMQMINLDGAIAFQKGRKYEENPHPENTPQRLAWSKGHTQARVASAIEKARSPILEAFVKFDALKENVEDTTDAYDNLLLGELNKLHPHVIRTMYKSEHMKPIIDKLREKKKNDGVLDPLEDFTDNKYSFIKESTKEMSETEDDPQDGYEHIRNDAIKATIHRGGIEDNPHPKDTHEHHVWEKAYKETREFIRDMSHINPFFAVAHALRKNPEADEPLKENRIIDYFKKSGM